MADSLNIVVGVTGGIAAYKAVGVVRFLVRAGHHVQVVATEHALRFVGAPTWEAISRNPLGADLYTDVSEVRHVALGQRADLVIIAPATANTLAKLAAGIADDLLGNTVLATRAPVLLAPAMHTEMWENAATRANLATLRGRGFHVVGPAVGQLTGTDSGAGRLSEPEEIVAAGLALVQSARDLAGRRILITAGGTREPLDPVRYLGNRSSGKQGIALAEAACARGAEVSLIAASVDEALPTHVRSRSVGTAAELAEAVHEELPATEIVIMAAAVADYRPVRVSETKIKKEDRGDTLTLELEKNPDILASLPPLATPGQIIVGFAAETARDRAHLLELGRAKLARKGCDYLCLNVVGWSDGFGADHNTVIMIDRAGEIRAEATGSKREVADAILDVLLAHPRPTP